MGKFKKHLFVKKNKLIQLMESIPAKEYDSILLFLESKAVNENPKASLLFSELIRIIKVSKKSGEVKISKEELFNLIYGNKQYNDDVLRKLMSFVIQKIELYLIFKESQKDKSFSKLSLLKYYRSSKLTKHFDGHFRYLENRKKTATYDADFFHTELGRFTEYNNFIGEYKGRQFPRKYQEASDALDQYFILEKLKMCVSILTHKRISKKEYNLVFLEEILDHLEKESSYLKVDSIKLFYMAIKIQLRRNDVWAFEDLIVQLSKQNNITIEDLRDIYFIAFNYCVQKVNEGHSRYLEKLYILYKQSLENNILLLNEKISPWNYKNIVSVGLRLKDYEWIYKFIQQYKKKLDGSDAQNAYNYNLARYYFYIKEYKKLLQLLQVVEYSDVFYKLDSKTLLLKAYYEMNEFDALHSLMDSFKQLLRRKKIISDNHKTNYLNLVRFLKRLSQINPRDKKRLATLKKQIDESSQIADKNWLLEKMEEKNNIYKISAQ